MVVLFDKNKVNTSRQVELDIAKAFSIIFMVLSHCLLISYFISDSTSSVFKTFVNFILGGPCAAPVFMFCMGVGIVFSRKSQPVLMIKRAIRLLFADYFINIIKFLIPFFIAGFFINEWDILDIYGGLIIFVNDILAFAALSLILLAIFKKFNFSYKKILFIAILMSVFGSFLRNMDFNNPMMNIFIGYFIGTKIDFSYFPLFNWFIFPAFGILYGDYFSRCLDKNKFFKFWPIFLLVSILFFVSTTIIPNAFLSNECSYYFMTTLDAVFCLIYIHGNLGFCHWISKFLPEKIRGMFTFLSKNITTIYLLQWFLIPFSFLLIFLFYDNFVFTELSIILAAFIILILSSFLIVAFRKLKQYVMKISYFNS